MEKSTKSTTCKRWAGVALALMLASAGPVWAQWKWKDSSGKVQYSDRPPPASVPDRDILQRPSGPRSIAPPPAEAPPAPAAAASALGVDKDLEARRRQEEQEREAKARAEKERMAQVRAENGSMSFRVESNTVTGASPARTGWPAGA
ncbi:DUF4124 domain-containing protein [Caldimonas manganoxidans]|uniref:DUF4124 domain-containing protein n=1 Tax=Caldimonas manganoxidans TaxID=196015 RepID=UPI0003642B83|nr:DUF4124 domain-containing protein [Caldimonas manganoxidans]